LLFFQNNETSPTAPAPPLSALAALAALAGDEREERQRFQSHLQLQLNQISGVGGGPLHRIPSENHNHANRINHHENQVKFQRAFGDGDFEFVSHFRIDESTSGGVGVNGTSGALIFVVTCPLFRGPAVSCASVAVASLLAKNEKTTLFHIFRSVFVKITRKMSFSITTTFLTPQSSYYERLKLVITCLQIAEVGILTEQTIFWEIRRGPAASGAGVAFI